MLGKTEKSEDDEVADTLDVTASEAQYLGPLQGTILLFCSEEDPIMFLPQSMSWEKLLGRPIPVVALPGDHHKIFDNPGARIMAPIILDNFRGT